jgi:multiple sugar transport system permease protein
MEKTPKEALDYGTAIVQRELDKVLTPIPGEPVNWAWFFVGYGVLLVVMILGAYWWDTRVGFRRSLVSIFSRKKKKTVGIGDVVEGSRGGYFRQQWWAGWIFASPWIIGFIIFGGGPLLFSIFMSFCDYDVINPAKWVGLANYTQMFTSDENIPIAAYNTIYMVIGVPIGMVASLAVALLLNQRIRGISIWRTIFYLPAIVPAVAGFILWIWILNPQGGIVNMLLDKIGIEGPNWLGSKYWSKPSLIFMGLWGAGGGMLIWLAGLKNISEQYYESAAIDGASEWQKFKYITLPLLSPYVFFNLVMGMIGVFQIFDAAFIMTQGGPVNSTLFWVYHLFNNAFRYGHMGYACAMAWILFVVIMALTAVQLKLAKHWVYYESE